MSLNIDDVERWQYAIVQKIQECTVENDQGYSFEIENFLPQGLYDRLSEVWPPVSELRTLSEAGLAAKRTARENAVTEARKVAEIGDMIARGPAEEALTWRVLASLLSGGEVIGAFYRKMQLLIAEERPEIYPVKAMHSQVLVQTDLDGFLLGPHLDAPKKVLSMMLYCPVNAENSTLGTSVFRPRSSFLEKNPAYQNNFIGKYHDPSDFDIVKTAKYIPNNLFGFIVGNRMFHGISQIKKENVLRRNIMWNIYHG
tara:strand:+ start:466 stop:1233 length:768 start_codon:yes stop_codon:yes gene_type:complete